MHIHVYCERGEAKFWLEPTIELALNSGMAARQIRVAKTLIEEHDDEIRNACKSTSGAEVTNISRHGFWLLVADEELFVSFKEFPWFKDASVSEILNVEWP